LVIEPLADDLSVTLSPDKVVVTRPLGLTLSTSVQTLMHGSELHSAVFDSQAWGSDRQGSYFAHESHLVDLAAAAAPHTAWRRGSSWRAFTSPAACIRSQGRTRRGARRREQVGRKHRRAGAGVPSPK